jgi:hypothetical protein
MGAILYALALWSCNRSRVNSQRMDKRKAHRKAQSKGKNGSGRVYARGPAWLIAALFALLAALFYAPMLTGVRAFPDGDFVHHFFPFSLYHHQELSAGRLPVWNPYTYGGHPFLADVQAAVFYPISNLLLLLTLPVTDAAARFYWLEVEAVLHTALAGWFAFLWLRDLTGSRWGGVMGGACFALSGFVTGYAPLQLAVLRSAVWLPLILWSLGRAWQQPHHWRLWIGSAGGLSADFLAGHSQSFMLLGYAAAAWTLCLAFVYRPLRWRAVAGTLGVLLVAIGLTAAQWMPSVEFVRLSVRANVDYDFVSGGLAPADFWQVLLPGVLTQYSPLYIGVAGVLLAVVALFSLRRDAAMPDLATHRILPWRAGILYCLGLALVALVASLGGNGPLYPLLYAAAPGWSWFRGQERAAYLVVVGLSGLAAYGMAALPRLNEAVRRRAAFVGGAAMVAVVYAFGLLWQLQRATALDHAGYLLMAGITLLLGLAMALLVSLPGWSLRRSAWIVALAVVNLVWANASVNQLPGSPADRVRVAPEVSALTEAVAAANSATGQMPGRVYNEFRAYDDYGMVAKIEDVWGSSPLRVARYDRLFDQFPLDRMWRLLGVEHVLTWRRELFGPSELLAEFPQATDTTYLHRLPQANARAWLVASVRTVDDDEAWTLLADHAFDLEQTGLLAAEYSDFGEVAGTLQGDHSYRLARRTTDTLEIAVQSGSDALLLVSETWLPGWQVSTMQCGGQACPSHDAQGRAYFAPMRANLTLLGIWVPAGESAFTLRYQPNSVRNGLWISGATLLLLLGATLWHGWNVRRAARP